jgi:hypothetical protein
MRGDTRTQRAESRLRGIVALCTAYLAAIVATLGFLAWKRDDSSLVTTDAWVHEVILLFFAVLTLRVATRAAAGSARAHLRLRIIAAVVVVASTAEASVPGLFPTWMRLEQILYGLCLLAVLALARSRGVRQALSRD